MPPKKPAPVLRNWRIALIKSTPAAFVGYVDAPDAESAIKKAIEEFKIADPQKQRRLIAQLAR
jgi:hypothetical protein